MAAKSGVRKDSEAIQIQRALGNVCLGARGGHRALHVVPVMPLMSKFLVRINPK